MKYILSVGLTAIIVLGTVYFLSPPSYHYKGIASISLHQANQLIQDKGEEQNIQVFSYNAEQDELYISYDFTGNKGDATTYNIPLGSPKSKWDIWWLFFIICTAIIIFITIQEWCNWGETKVTSPSVRERK